MERSTLEATLESTHSWWTSRLPTSTCRGGDRAPSRELSLMTLS